MFGLPACLVTAGLLAGLLPDGRAGLITPEDHGAIGDGVANDTLAMRVTPRRR